MILGIGAVVVFGAGVAWLLLRAYTAEVRRARVTDAELARQQRESDIELTKTLVAEVTQAITGRPNLPTVEEMLEAAEFEDDLPEEHVIPDTELDDLWFAEDAQAAREGEIWPQSPDEVPQPPA